MCGLSGVSRVWADELSFVYVAFGGRWLLVKRGVGRAAAQPGQRRTTRDRSFAKFKMSR